MGGRSGGQKRPMVVRTLTLQPGRGGEWAPASKAACLPTGTSSMERTAKTQC